MSQPELGVLIEPPAKPPKREPASKPRKRDEVFDDLVRATGGNPYQMTKSEAGAAGVALAEIRKATPGVKKLDVWHAVENYRKLFPKAACTPNAIASHWSKCSSPTQQTSEPKSFQLGFKERDALVKESEALKAERVAHVGKRPYARGPNHEQRLAAIDSRIAEIERKLE